MDAASRNVAAFLESLQDARRRLADVWNRAPWRGGEPCESFLLLGNAFMVDHGESVRQYHGEVTLGLRAKDAEDREFTCTVNVLWGAEGWTITSQAWQGDRLLGELPERRASALDQCLEQLRAAVEGVRSFDPLFAGEEAWA